VCSFTQWWVVTYHSKATTTKKCSAKSDQLTSTSTTQNSTAFQAIAKTWLRTCLSWVSQKDLMESSVCSTSGSKSLIQENTRKRDLAMTPSTDLLIIKENQCSRKHAWICLWKWQRQKRWQICANNLERLIKMVREWLQLESLRTRFRRKIWICLKLSFKRLSMK